MADGIEAEKGAPLGERLCGPRQRLRVRSDRRQMPDTHAVGVDADRFKHVELFDRACRTALMRRMREDWQVRPEVGLPDRAKQLPLFWLHLLRRSDLAERSPSLSLRVPDEMLDQLLFGHLGDIGRRFCRYREVLIVATA